MTRLDVIHIPRPYTPLVRFHPRDIPFDPREALGLRRIEGHPDDACVYCWPALVASTHFDHDGNACCARCKTIANRVRQLPLFKPYMFNGCARRSA